MGGGRGGGDVNTNNLNLTAHEFYILYDILPEQDLSIFGHFSAIIRNALLQDIFRFLKHLSTLDISYIADNLMQYKIVEW